MKKSTDTDEKGDYNEWIDTVSKEISASRINVVDLKQKLCGPTPNMKEGIDTFLSKKEVSWGYALFPFDLVYAAMKQPDDAQLKIYQMDRYTKPMDCTMADFLNIDTKDETSAKFWKKELKKYTKKDSKSTIFALALRCNAYSLNFPNIESQTIPFWVTAFLDEAGSEFQVLFAKIDLINTHVYIQHCVGSISLSSISIKGLVFVFGLHINGQLELTNGFAASGQNESLKNSVALALTVSSEGDKPLSYSVILEHWKKTFPKFKALFTALEFLFCQTQIVHFSCKLTASITTTLHQTERGKENEKESDEKAAKEKAEKEKAKEERTGRKKIKKEDDAPKPVTYAIDLSFQPQIDPKGAVGTIFKLLGIPFQEIEDMFPLKLYLKGDNADGLKIGAKVEKRYPIKTWLFGIEIIYFDSLQWSGGIEYDTEEDEVTLEVSAALFLMLKLDFIPDLGQALISGFMSAKVNLMDPTTAEITIGWCVKLGDENGWDPFSLVKLDSGVKLKSIAMGMSVTAEGQLCIMCASSFSITFADEAGDDEKEKDKGKNDIIIALKVAIDPAKEIAYPTAFHFEQKGEVQLRSVMKLLAPPGFSALTDQCPDIAVRNCMFSFGLDKKTEIVYDIGFAADKEDDDDDDDEDEKGKKKAIKMADALKHLDKYHLENKVVTITQGLRMKGEMTICDVIKMEGELVLSPSLFKMKIGFEAEAEKMEKFQKQIYEELKTRLDAYEKTLFPDSFKGEIQKIAKKLNKWTLGAFDVLTGGNGERLFAAALEWGFDTAKMIVMKTFQIVKTVVKFVLDNIAIYKFLYDLEVSTSEVPVFRFKLNMRIGDFIIDIDIDTKRDFSVKAFFKALLDASKFWADLLADAAKKAANFIGSVAKRIGKFLWKYLGGEMIVNFFNERQRRIDEYNNILKAAEEKRLAWEKEMARKRAQWKAEIDDMKARKKESKERFLKDEIAYYEKGQKEMEAKRGEIKSKLTFYEANIARLEDQIAQRNVEKAAELEGMDAAIKGLEARYKAEDDIIRKAIGETAQDEANVSRFLKVLNDGLLFALTQNAQSTDTLSMKMSSFHELIKKDCEYKLSIEEWFGVQGLIRFIPILHADALDDYTGMEDVADDCDGFIETLQEVIASDANKDVADITEKERKLIQTFGDDQKENPWRKHQNEQQTIIKQRLVQTTPILIEFLDRMTRAVDYTSQLLCYPKQKGEMTPEQKDAIKNVEIEKMKPMAMKIYDDNDIKAAEEDDANKYQSLVNKDTLDGINKILAVGTGTDDTKETDEDDANKYKSYLQSKQLHEMHAMDDIKDIMDECKAIETAARLKLSVVQSLRSKYDGEEAPAMDALHRESMFQLASTIEYCCVEMVEKQCMVRKSVLLARRIIEFKPSKLSNEAKPLWDAIGEGIKKIFIDAIEMSGVCAKYFTFLVKLKDAFEQFRSRVEISEDASLALALELVQKDVDEFVSFGAKGIAPVMEKLAQSAHDIVKKCARGNHVNEAMEKRRVAQEEYLKKRKEFNGVRFRYDDVYHGLRSKYAQLNGEYQSKLYYQQYINDSISTYQQYLKDLRMDQKREQQES